MLKAHLHYMRAKMRKGLLRITIAYIVAIHVSEVATVGWGALRKIWAALYTLVLLVGLAVMISPLPEGTLLLSLLLSYFGYQLTGNLYVTGAIYVVTFLFTLVLIQKLHLIAKFKTQLAKLRDRARAK